MGFGDELMATGQARLMQARDPRPVAVRGKDGRARWHPIFDGNPRLSRTGAGDVQWLNNWPGYRPYIERFDATRFVFREWECPRGELYLSAAEKAVGERYPGRLIIQPLVKMPTASLNKDWGFSRWQRVVDARPDLPWTQLGPTGTRLLRGASLIATPDFRSAAAILARSRGYVGVEGGMHHAAAAFRLPAVVVFGGFVSPAQTGYPDHRNLYAGGQPCGMRKPCAHCRKAMAAITPEMVLEQVESIV